MADVKFNSKDDEIAALRAVIVEFIDATSWRYVKNIELRDARERAADMVPGIRGVPPDQFSATLAAAKALRLNQCQ